MGFDEGGTGLVNPDRRKSIRLTCSVFIELRRQDAQWVGECGDISEGGLRCRSHEEPCDLFHEQDLVSFVAVLPVGRIEGTAKVVRVSQHSIALEFETVEPGTRELVRRYVMFPGRV